MRLSTFALAALLPAAALAAPIKIESQALAVRDTADPGKNNYPAVARHRKRENWGDAPKCIPKGHRKEEWKGKHDPASDNYDPDAHKSWHHDDENKSSDDNKSDDKSWEHNESASAAPPAVPASTEAASTPAWTEAPTSTTWAEETPAPTEEPTQSPPAQAEESWVEAPSSSSSADDWNILGYEFHAAEPEPTTTAAPEPEPTPEPAPEPTPEPAPEPVPEPQQQSYSGGGGNWDFPAGKATHWETSHEDFWCRSSPGGEGLPRNDGDMVVAISHTFWGNNYQLQNYDKCGQWVELQWNDRPPVRAQVIDACMDCSTEHIDLSKGTFQAVGAPNPWDQSIDLGVLGDNVEHAGNSAYESPNIFKWKFV